MPTPSSPSVPTQSPQVPEAGVLSLRQVGEHLQRAWIGLLDPGSGEIPRPTRLASEWGLDQTLCTRLIQALREPDVVFALRRLPSPVSLRVVLRVAEQRKVSGDRVSEASRAVENLDRLIGRLGGTKSNLDTLIARRVDHSREKVEQSAKQLVFRGMTNLLGVEAEASVIACFAFPSEDQKHVDELVVHGYHRLRRLRPELPLMLGTREMLPDAEGVDQSEALLESLQGGKISANGATTALLEFCTDPLPEIEVRADESRLLYALPAQPDQIGGELDLFFASMLRNADPRFATAEHTRARYAYIPQNPTRHLVLDVYIHEELWQGVEPELVLVRSGNAGAPDLLAHSLDRLDYVETLGRYGTSSSAVPCQAYQRQLELVNSIHDRMGWRRESFRLFRCEVKYPVIGTWYTIQFPLPVA